MVCVVACSRNTPTISGKFSPTDLAQIDQVVHSELFSQLPAAAGRPIKSITATNKSSYNFYTHARSFYIDEAQTNPIAKAQLVEIEAKLALLAQTETNAEAEVWYADKIAHWDEAGFLLEKGTNGWAITVRLSR